MKRIFLVAAGLLLGILLAGCGSGGDGPPLFFTSILSDATQDGDIQKAPLTGTYTVTQGNTQSVLSGVDPVSGTEYRAFLSFPLTGSGGVPGNAIIASAVLDIVVNGIVPQPLVGSIPIRIDLISRQVPLLLGNDFDRTLQPALASITVTPPISQSDFGRHVSIDVTSFMQEAQRLRLGSLQLRILEDLGFQTPGVIEINDTTGPNRDALGPLLQVTYF